MIKLCFLTTKPNIHEMKIIWSRRVTSFKRNKFNLHPPTYSSPSLYQETATKEHMINYIKLFFNETTMLYAFWKVVIEGSSLLRFTGLSVSGG
jgi:hypothetical protein